ncbi:MAG: hypothetical protein ACE5DI_00280 [Candidatus Micrarchaeia archaeon]
MEEKKPKIVSQNTQITEGPPWVNTKKENLPVETKQQLPVEQPQENKTPRKIEDTPKQPTQQKTDQKPATQEQQTNLERPKTEENTTTQALPPKEPRQSQEPTQTTTERQQAQTTQNAETPLSAEAKPKVVETRDYSLLDEQTPEEKKKSALDKMREKAYDDKKKITPKNAWYEIKGFFSDIAKKLKGDE